MKYLSSRENYQSVKAEKAVLLGMVPAGGLFVPAEIPQFSLEEILAVKDKSYKELTVWILKKFLKSFNSKEIENIVEKAYSEKNFPVEEITPVYKLNSNSYILELWHGPTAAFKDLALQLLPHLLVKSKEKLKEKKEIVILTATSGDTGKAALEGFKDVENIKIIVFYPENGVSKIQEDQMLTTAAENTAVVAVKGNFDDCQKAVKDIFADKKLKEKIEKNNFKFSSANSINWGRLMPQIVYYFKAYFKLLQKKEIKAGEKINISVPTGNFGNILAAYYAARMGLPIKKFICASNENKILTDFINTGIYDAERSFKKTISPSMDILISSNLERFLFEINGHQSEKIINYYQNLKDNNKFQIDKETLNKIQKLFNGQYSSEKELRTTIKNVYQKFNYLIDPHTAVAVNALLKYRSNSGDQTPAVIASTANPYKFSKAVLESLKDESYSQSEYRIIEKLEELSQTKAHRALKGLENLKSRHHNKANKNQLKEKVLEILGI